MRLPATRLVAEELADCSSSMFEEMLGSYLGKSFRKFRETFRNFAVTGEPSFCAWLFPETRESVWVSSLFNFRLTFNLILFKQGFQLQTS